MPVTICFANMKGGVGKTTLCVNLAFELFDIGKKVLVVDNDPQFNATSSLVSPASYIENCIKSDKNKTIYNIYEKPPRIKGGKTKKIDPNKFFLKTWHFVNSPEIVLDLIPSRIELYETLKNPSTKEYLLNNFLKKYATKYDYILIDCPPTPSILTISAFAASDYVITPVTPDFYATMGLPQFIGTLSDFKEDLPDPNNVTPLGVIFTNVDRQPSSSVKKSMSLVRSTLADFPEGIPVFNSKMSHFEVYKRSIWQSVTVHKIKGPGTRGKGLAIAELGNIRVELEKKILELKESEI